MLTLLDFDSELNKNVFADLQIKKNNLLFYFKTVGLEVIPRDFADSCTGPWQRADELWKQTCFEAFWAEPSAKKYWELNVGLNNQWNVYEFQDYRTPVKLNPSFDFDLLSVQYKDEILTISLKSDLRYTEIHASLCMVLTQKNQKIKYFSQKHAAVKPDFHLRSNFTMHRRIE